MAAKALTSRAIQYFPNLRAMVNRTRPCLGAQLSTSSVGTASYTKKVSGQQWTEKRLGPFAPTNPKFPLPGNMGLPLEKEEKTVPTSSTARSLVETFYEISLEESQKLKSIGTFLTSFEAEPDLQQSTLENDTTPVNKQQVGTVECSVQTCPTFLHNGFMELFPDQHLQPNELTIISISQHTKFDMSSWSLEVEEERESLMQSFVESAKEICGNLVSAGYWADFVDPSSGTAFFGPHTNTTFFETDDRFNHLGFNIIDLGCCKVISHHLWGTHAFVGSIFTDAPTDSEILGQSLEQ